MGQNGVLDFEPDEGGRHSIECKKALFYNVDTVMKHDLGNVIAQRVYFRAGDSTHSAVVQVQIGTPRTSPYAQDEYMCSYRVKSPESDFTDTAYGIDALQALQLALGSVEARLRYLNQSCDLALRWLGDKNGDLGIRIPTFS
jgi:hypothetical protein